MPRRLLDDDDGLIRGQKKERDREDRDPLSWRDRDRKKDKSAHVARDPRDFSSPGGPQDRYLKERERKANLDIANALFAKPEQRALETKILSASSADLDRLVDEYVQAYGYPSSPDLLAKFVGHSSIDTVKASLKQLQQTITDLEPKKRDSLAQSLKLIGMMGRDPAARRAVSGFLRRNNLTNV